MPHHVARDPFARGALLRRTHTQGKCHWCGTRACHESSSTGSPGCARHPGQPHAKRLYSYQWDADDSGTQHTSESEQFCGLACYRAFYA